VAGEAQRPDLGNRREDSSRCLRERMNLDNRMIIDGLTEHRVTLTVAILYRTRLKFSNVLRNEEIQLTKGIGLSVPLSADAMLWMGLATVLISELAFSAASNFRAASTVVTSGVSSWSVGVSCFIREYSG